MTINRILIYICALVLWSSGIYTYAYYNGKDAKRVAILENKLKHTEMVLQTERANIQKAAEHEHSLEALNNQTVDKYNEAREKLKHDKDIINRDNRINTDLVRIIQQSGNSCNMPETSATTKSARQESATITPTKLIEYTIDLQEYGEKCRNQNNQLIDFYNSLRLSQ